MNEMFSTGGDTETNQDLCARYIDEGETKKGVIERRSK